MFGLLKLHGAIITGEEDDNGNLGVHENPYSWNKNHNMLYIDNPVGAGAWVHNTDNDNHDHHVLVL